MTVIELTPAAIAIRAWNRPSLSASTVVVAPLSSLRTRTELLAWVLPLMVTVSLLVVAPSLGEMMVSLGFDVSSVHATTGDRSLSPPGPTTEAWNSLRPFASAMFGRSWTAVWPTGCSAATTGALSPTVTHSRIEYPGRPVTSDGTSTVTSTVSSFVNGWSGATIVGASLVGGDAVGGALPTTAPTVFTNPPRPLTMLPTTGPTAPPATHRMPRPSAATAAARTAPNGRGRPRRRSMRRCRASRCGDGATGRTFGRNGRPNESGRGRTCGGRPPRR